MNSTRHLLRLLFLITATCFTASFAANAQLIKEEFTVPAFHDAFDDDKDTWRNMSTSDNLFLIQDGEYLLRRKNSASGYSIFPKWKNKLGAFSLSAAMKLEDSKNEDACVGLIFMAQEDATGAFVFEFNPKGQYRLKQLVGLSYKLLTGDVKSNGWVDSDVMNGLGEYNIVEIRTFKRNYDVYVNDKYLLSFTEIAYKSGDIGISIGPATKARVDYISVTEPAGETARTTSDKPPGENSKSPATPPAQASQSGSSDVVLKLVEQISNLKVENQSLRDSILILKKQLKAANAARSTER